MHRWSTGQITDAQLMDELSTFVFNVKGKGQLLESALMIAQGEKEEGLSLLKKVIAQIKTETKDKRVVNQKVMA